MNSHIRHLAVALILGFLCLGFQTTRIAVIDPRQWTDSSENSRLLAIEETVLRGQILDRNGVVLDGRRVDTAGVVQRVYRDPTLSPVLGYSDWQRSRAGLEASADSFLDGRHLDLNWDRLLSQWEHRPYAGDNVQTTLDDRLQREVEQIMPDAPSAAIVANPNTGEILALVSKPHLDLTRIDEPGYWASQVHDKTGAPFVNRVTDGYYAPGSTFKIVTLAAAMDAHLVSLNTQYVGVAATGPLTVDGHTFSASINNLPECFHSPPISLAVAFACSDNIVFAELSLRLGQKRWLRYARAFGMDAAPPFDIPTTRSVTHLGPDPMSSFELASAGFGQGYIHVTPLQMLMIDEAVAEGGRIPRPMLVSKVISPQGSLVRQYGPSTLYHPISSATASAVRDAMVQAVDTPYGSGRAAQIPGIAVAGKTGTAEAGDGAAPHAWFVGFAPAYHPKVAVALVVEHAGEGAVVAAPLARRILTAALAEP